ncbi:MAG: ATP-binding protein [Candidatus Ratteibacteria bacterium]|nr:ATP-binding protein [Candidatus Ratteibacteria bacterium]
MAKPLKTITGTVKGTVEVLVKPVVGLVDGFNFLMRKIEERTGEKKEGPEMDGFVNILLKEMKDAEQGVLAFFTEMMFMQHLSEKMAQVENEITLIQILGDKINEFISPDFVEIFLCGADGRSFHLVYHFPSEKEFSPALVKNLALDCFQRGESIVKEKVKLEGKGFSILAAPLRTTRERFGAVVVGKRGKGVITTNESALVISGAVVVSFAMSNIKLVNNIIKNQRLVTIGETIGGLSHDIKNILNNLENGIELVDMAAESSNSEMLREGRKILRNSYEKMKHLVLSMVDYSREREIELVPSNINSVIKGAISIMKGTCKEKRVKIIEELDKHLPIIDIDPSRIERMMINLLDNAIDAVEEKIGIIKVRTRFLVSDGAIEISVEDNGCGIPEENLERIFDIFYSTKGNRGTGFGLAIVQKVVKEHNGTIEVKSEVGKGTVFIIKIPVKERGKNG